MTDSIILLLNRLGVATRLESLFMNTTLRSLHVAMVIATVTLYESTI